MAFPMKSRFSLSVPAATSTVSPLFAALIPSWIVGSSCGTRIVVCATLPPQNTNPDIHNNPSPPIRDRPARRLIRSELRIFFPITPASLLVDQKSLAGPSSNDHWPAQKNKEHRLAQEPRSLAG